jgi:hypothetical protein
MKARGIAGSGRTHKSQVMEPRGNPMWPIQGRDETARRQNPIVRRRRALCLVMGLFHTSFPVSDRERQRAT